MFVLSKFSIIVTASASIVLDTIDQRFGVTFDSVDGTGTIPGYAQLSLTAQSNFLLTTNLHSSQWEESLPLYQFAQAVTIRSDQGELRYPIGTRFQVINGETFAYLEPTLRISASPRSDFVRSISGFAFEPITDIAGRIHINPESVTDLTYGGEIVYTSIVQDSFWSSVWGSTDFWGINTAISLVNPGETIQTPSQLNFRPCIIDHPGGQQDLLHIPSSIYQTLLGLITTRGLEIRRRNYDAGMERYIRGTLTDDIISSLPTIQYIVPSTEGVPFSIASIPPSAYIVATDDPRSHKLLVARSGPTEICHLTKPIHSKLVVHFDIENHRIGFGEPIVEL